MCDKRLNMEYKVCHVQKLTFHDNTFRKPDVLKGKYSIRDAYNFVANFT